MPFAKGTIDEFCRHSRGGGNPEFFDFPRTGFPITASGMTKSSFAKGSHGRTFLYSSGVPLSISACWPPGLEA
jgi:hypothetical protein